MSYIRVVNDIAVDSVEIDPFQCFTPNIASEFIYVGETVIPGSQLIDNVWVAPTPIPIPVFYKPLSKLGFINHLLANGLTNTQLVNANSDPNLQVFWIKLGFASEVVRDNLDVAEGIDALIELNYLTIENKESIFNTWPTW